MFMLNDTDVLEAWSDTDAVIDYHIFGLIGSTWTRLASGTLSNGANTVIYTAGAATSVVAIQFTNTAGAAATVNLKLDPADGGNDKFMLPVAVSLAPGNTLIFDGQRARTMNVSAENLVAYPSPLAVSSGGTGLTSYAVGDLIYASGATTLSRLADVAVGQVLISGGVGVAPSWSGSPWFSGDVGFGIAVPAGRLHVVDPDFVGLALFERNELNADTPATSMKLLATKASNMGDGFGPLMAFIIQDDGGLHNTIAEIGALRSGADNTGDLVFRTNRMGAPNERMRITSDGIVIMLAAYGHDMNGETYRNLLINDAGELGYDSSP